MVPDVPGREVAVLNGTYRPQPHKLVEIVKKGGGTRTLRLAVIADRILVKAVAGAFGPFAESTFLCALRVQTEAEPVPRSTSRSSSPRTPTDRTSE